MLYQPLIGLKVFRGIIYFLIHIESLAFYCCCHLHELTGQSHKVVAQFLYFRRVLGIAHTDEVSSTSLLLIAPGIEAGDLENCGQEINLNEIDQHYFSCVEEELYSEDGVELECDVSLLVEEVTVEFLEGVDDPIPK